MQFEPCNFLLDMGLQVRQLDAFKLQVVHWYEHN